MAVVDRPGVTQRDAATSSEADQGKPATALRSRGAWILFGSIFVAGLIADLWSKAAAFDWVLRTAPISATKVILPGVLRFRLSTNPGVAFGADWIPDIAVILATVVAAVIVVLFFAAGPRRARWTQSALAMILAGAIGNLYDRLFSRVQLPGRPESINEVRDFIDFSPLHIGPLNYPWTFNIADVLLVVGVAILMVISLHQSWRERAEAKAAKKSG